MNRINHNTGDHISAANASWNFGGEVPANFEEHASRSIPLYGESHDLIARISDYFLTDGSTLYDLGCATGLLLKKIAARHQRPVRLIGIDREAGMIEEARGNCSGDERIRLIEGDLLQFEFEKCDMIVAFYTMQFVRPAFRQQLFDRIFEALRWGGAFLLFEKVRGADARFQDILTGLYTDYKLERGYSPDEIVAKSRSLKGVLEPFSSAGNAALLSRAGFVDFMPVLRYVNFEGILAIK
jgi:tRNA (cmo5U34)-methyltransferase